LPASQFDPISATAGLVFGECEFVSPTSSKCWQTASVRTKFYEISQISNLTTFVRV